MDPDTTTETGDTTEETSVTETAEVETIAIPKSDYEKLNQTLGSLKRELKDLRKPKEEAPKTETTPEVPPLLQKSFLRAAGISHPEDVDLALTTAKKWNMDIDALVDDADFQAKLEKQQTARSNAIATSNVRGGNGTQSTKNTTEYWVAKGTPPTPADVPDRKVRAKIVRDMMAHAKVGKKFYND